MNWDIIQGKWDQIKGSVKEQWGDLTDDEVTQIAGNQDELFAYVLVLGILGLLVQGLSQWGERRLLHWHPQYRKQVV